jgi:transposase-like protein
MSKRGPYRRHSAQFKLQLCQEIRSGGLGRRDAQEKYSLSANLIQLWQSRPRKSEQAAKWIGCSRGRGHRPA